MAFEMNENIYFLNASFYLWLIVFVLKMVHIWPYYIKIVNECLLPNISITIYSLFNFPKYLLGCHLLFNLIDFIHTHQLHCEPRHHTALSIVLTHITVSSPRGHTQCCEYRMQGVVPNGLSARRRARLKVLVTEQQNCVDTHVQLFEQNAQHVTPNMSCQVFS